jgi:hypothetical protein
MQEVADAAARAKLMQAAVKRRLAPGSPSGLPDLLLTAMDDMAASPHQPDACMRLNERQETESRPFVYRAQCTWQWCEPAARKGGRVPCG